MTGKALRRDLVVLAADSNIEFALRGLLANPERLGIRQVTVDFYKHPQHDPGCRLGSHEFLRPMLRSHAFALTVFDREGCGRSAAPAADLAAFVEKRLAQNGWEERAAAIVIDPELEQWVWRNSPEVEAVLGWAGRALTLSSWLVGNGWLGQGQRKPSKPKEALEAALRVVGKPRSSSVYEQLGRCAPLTPCDDAAFSKLHGVLRAWFGTQ